MRDSVRAFVGIAVLGATSCLLVGAASAQTASSRTRLTVLIVDDTGAVLVGASVAVADGRNSSALSAESDARGEAAFTLPKGTYSVRASAAAFSEATITNVRVDGREAHLRIQLHVAGVASNVTVEANPRLRRSDIDDLAFASILTADQLAALPDDPETMTRVLEAMAGPNATIRVDGFRSRTLPMKRLIKQVRFSWTPFSAQYHEVAGVQIEIITFSRVDRTAADVGAELHDSAFNAGDSVLDGALESREIAGSSSLVAPLARNGAVRLSLSSRRHNEQVPLFVAAPGLLFPDRVDTGATSTVAVAGISNDFASGQTLRVTTTSAWRSSTGQGRGGTSLPEHGASWNGRDLTLRASLVGALAGRYMNQLRFEATDSRTEIVPDTLGPEMRVEGAFIGGGASQRGSRRTRTIGFENDLDLPLGRHAIRLGTDVRHVSLDSSVRTNTQGTFYFDGIGSYQAAAPELHTRRNGDQEVAFGSATVGTYVQDDVRITRALVAGAGLRVETQSHFGTAVASRAGVSWAVDQKGKFNLRLGGGLYFNWIPTSTLEHVLRLDGRHGWEESISDPTYPDATAGGAASPSAARITNIVYQFDSQASLPRTVRFSIGTDWKANSRFSLGVTFDSLRTTNVLWARNLLPNSERGTSEPVPAASQIRSLVPLGRLRESVIRVMPRFGSAPWPFAYLSPLYVCSWKYSTNDGPFSLPSDTSSPQSDWGPASDDVRHRFSGALVTRTWKGVDATVVWETASGIPFSAMLGNDSNGDGQLNDRALGTGRNALRGAWRKSVGAVLRWSRTSPASASAPAPAHAPKVTAELHIDNVLGATAAGDYMDVVGSPMFGRPTAVSRPRRVWFAGHVFF